MAAWPEVVGAKLATMTRAVSFVEGVLLVKVSNSSLHSLLFRYEKGPLLRRLRQKFPAVSITDIVFRIG